MKIGKLLGGGAFADVYEGHDRLGRKVAIKIVRASAETISSALDHAKALARSEHPNVVRVYTIETIEDPESGEETDAIIMEFLDGPTLGKVLSSRKIERDEVEAICRGLVAGMRHIHQEGLSHGDLHEDNVIVSNHGPKIIDILYRQSLSILSTASRESRVRGDLTSLRLMLYQLILKSSADPSEATDFNAAMPTDASLEHMERAIEELFDPQRQNNLAERIEFAYTRIVDEGFVDDDRYAKALSDDTSDDVCEQVLMRVVDRGSVGRKHRAYLRLLWDRLEPSAKGRVASAVERKLTETTPTGGWGAPMNLLLSFGRECWSEFSDPGRIRLESVVANDILAGYYDIYGDNVRSPGILGTYVNSLWPLFQDRQRIIDNISALLLKGWYTQNYVGHNFMGLLATLPQNSEQREQLLSGLRVALDNDAKLIDRNLEKLPADWRQELARKRTSGLDDVDLPF